MHTTSEPLLAPPGAGLPKPELFIARILFRLYRWKGDRDAFNARFSSERAAIRTLIEPCTPEIGGRRVLIERLRGLEDSSRFWSVWMTLDHLRIVHDQIARVIGSLARGVVPDGKASTAGVKPSTAVTAAIVAEYEASCDALLAAVAPVPEPRSTPSYAHPWFGPLNVSDWHAMAGLHMGIHRNQIERIIAVAPLKG